jgi:hypothetical protein
MYRGQMIYYADVGLQSVSGSSVYMLVKYITHERVNV